MSIGHKLHAFGFHLFEAPVQDVLFHLELGNSVTEQSSDSVGLLVNRDPVPGAIQLLRGRETCRPGADDCYFLSCTEFWRLRTNESLFPSALDNAFFNLLDRDSGLIDSKYACGLARRRANASGKFRKIVCRVKLPKRLFPAPAINQVIPIWNEIVDRTSGVTEGYAAIHAARALRT